MDDPIGERSLHNLSEQAAWYNDLIFNKFIKNNLGERTLEIGSGIGNFTKMIATASKSVTATDIRAGYLKALKRIRSRKINVAYGDIEKNIFKPGQSRFDSIVCLNVLEHIKDDKKALTNMKNKLNKRGKLILLVPAHQEFFGTLDENLGHYRRYNIPGLSKKIREAGFKGHNIQYFNPVSGLGWYVNAKILKKELVDNSALKVFNLIIRPFLFLENFIKPPFGLSVVVVAEK